MPSAFRVVAAPPARARSGARRRCEVFLDALVAPLASMSFACVADGKGRIAAVSQAAADAARAATIASRLALGESLGREVLRGRCAHSTVVSRDGVVVSVRIPAERGGVLSIGADATQTPSRVLLHALDAAERLAGILDSQLGRAPSKPPVANGGGPARCAARRGARNAASPRSR